MGYLCLVYFSFCSVACLVFSLTAFHVFLRSQQDFFRVVFTSLISACYQCCAKQRRSWLHLCSTNSQTKLSVDGTTSPFSQHNGRGVCRWKPLNRSVDDIQDETKFAAWHFLAVLPLQEGKLIYITGTDNYYRMHGERRFAE